MYKLFTFALYKPRESSRGRISLPQNGSAPQYYLQQFHSDNHMKKVTTIILTFVLFKKCGLLYRRSGARAGAPSKYFQGVRAAKKWCCSITLQVTYQYDYKRKIEVKQILLNTKIKNHCKKVKNFSEFSSLPCPWIQIQSRAGIFRRFFLTIVLYHTWCCKPLFRSNWFVTSVMRVDGLYTVYGGGGGRPVFPTFQKFGCISFQLIISFKQQVSTWGQIFMIIWPESFKKSLQHWGMPYTTPTPTVQTVNLIKMTKDSKTVVNYNNNRNYDLA
jgi:hypothetical protein